MSKKLYKISEKIRCEKIGSNYFKGVKNNIEEFYKKRISEAVIQRLLQNGWIDKDSLIILEKSKKENFNLNAHLSLIHI